MQIGHRQRMEWTTHDPEKHNLLNYGTEEDKKKCLQAGKEAQKELSYD